MEKYISRKQLAKLLGVSERTIWNYELRGLPVTKLSDRSRRYSESKVETWLNNNTSSRYADPEAGK